MAGMPIMEIIVRDYSPKDANQIIQVAKEAHGPLLQSRGGLHPDESLEKFLAMDDSAFISMLTKGTTILVAELRESGLIVGTAGFTATRYDRTIGSAYSRNMFVREAFQRGKAGVNVGTLLRKAILEKARAMGFRKIYGFSTPEAVGFHKRFSAIFIPVFNVDYLEGNVPVHYYEIRLRPSILNSIPIEPLMFRLFRLSEAIRSRLSLASGR